MARCTRIATDMFDDPKFQAIEAMPHGYAIIVIWFKLLCFAKQRGSRHIPYPTKILSDVFRQPESVIEAALAVFEQFGMIHRNNGVISIKTIELPDRRL